MMPDQLARQEQIARRLEQSRHLLQGVSDASTAKRIVNLIDDLENERTKEREKRMHMADAIRGGAMQPLCPNASDALAWGPRPPGTTTQRQFDAQP